MTTFESPFMQSDVNRPRRVILISAVGAPAAWMLGGLAGCGNRADQEDRQLSFMSLADAETELARLAAAKTLHSAAKWTWAETLVHCAQSIEYSMTGYPQQKSKLFQSTVGPAALDFFAWRGRMSHDLAEPIPGAPALPAQADPVAALARLRAAMLGFLTWDKPLQPHFAYGELDKKAYERAHAMHIANHLSQFQLAA